MTVVVYLDLFFLVNWVADLILLFLVRQILRQSVWGSLRGLLVAATVGAGLSCGMLLFPNLPVILRILLWMFLPALSMVRLAFGRCSLRELGWRLLLLWMLAVCCGGFILMVGAAYVANGESKLWRAQSLAPAFLAGGTLLLGAVRHVRRTLALAGNFYEVTLYEQGKQKQVRALKDTGNQLYEPYTHQPVHILEEPIWKELGDRHAGMICIPFCSVGKEAGLLLAVRIERMEICQSGSLVCVLQKPWIAISKTPLSPRHQYEMLLHGAFDTTS